MVWPEFTGFYETTEDRLVNYGTGYSVLTGNFPDIVGRDQNGALHMAVTDYTAFLIKELGIPLVGGGMLLNAEPDEILNKAVYFNLEPVVITGVIKTDFERFKPHFVKILTERDTNDNLSWLCPKIVSDIYARLQGSCLYTSFFVLQGTHEGLYVNSRIDGGYQLYSQSFFNEITAIQAGTFRPVKITLSHGKQGLSEGEVLLAESSFLQFFGTRFRQDGDYDFTYMRALRIGGEDSLYNAGTFKVVGVFTDVDSKYLGSMGINHAAVFTDDEFDEIANGAVSVVGFHVKLPDSRADRVRFVNFLDEHMFFHFSENHRAVYEVYNKISVYRNVFFYITIVLALASALLVGEFMLSNIKDRTGEIGILRSLGVRGADISIIFFLQALVLFVLASVACAGLIAGLTAMLNGIIYNDLTSYLNPAILESVPILTLSALPFVATFAIIAGVLLLATALPTIKIIVVKPIKCISRK
jgi:hypothetical protein